MKISIIYILLPFVTLFVVPQTRIKKSGQNNMIIFAFALSYLVLCGLRDGGGADDISYKMYYDNGYGGSVLQMFSGKEPLFNLLRLLCKSLKLNYKGLFLTYAIITVVFLCKALQNYHLDKYDLVLYIAAFYFIVFSGMFTTMRQAVAMSMLFYLKSCKNVTWKKRLLMWLLIVCTHYGFAILIPIELLLILKKFEIAPYLKILVPLGSLVVGRFLQLETVVLKITNFLGLYSYMNDKENYTSVAGLGIVVLCLFAMYIFNVFLQMRRGGFNGNDNDENNKIEESVMLYFTLMFLTINMRWGNRICYYYLQFIPFVVIKFADHFTLKRSSRKVKALASIILFAVFEWIMMSYFGADGYKWSIRLWG